MPILLDVDNGPDGLSRRANDNLYDCTGLKAAMTALRPRGILAVWSAYSDPAFAERLRDAGFEVAETIVRENDAADAATHVIWFAQKP